MQKGCKLYGWNDDPILFPVGQRNGIIITFLPLAPDRRFGGAYNTRQTVQHFVEGDRWNNRRSVERTTWDLWANMPMIRSAQVKPGLMLSDKDLALYTAALSPSNWREWTEGLPTEEVVDGQLRIQREVGRWAKSQGTLTFFQQPQALVIDTHVATLERVLEATVFDSAGSNSIVTASGSGDQLGWLFSTLFAEPDNPNDDDWPNGEYRCQLDMITGNNNVSYGLLTLGASDGHFARIDAGTTTDLETWTQDEAAFSGTGLKLATHTINPSSGAVTDHYELLIALEDIRPHGGNATNTLSVDADAFADGPWESFATRANIQTRFHRNAVQEIF